MHTKSITLLLGYVVVFAAVPLKATGQSASTYDIDFLEAGVLIGGTQAMDFPAIRGKYNRMDAPCTRRHELDESPKLDQTFLVNPKGEYLEYEFNICAGTAFAHVRILALDPMYHRQGKNLPTQLFGILDLLTRDQLRHLVLRESPKECHSWNIKLHGKNGKDLMRIEIGEPEDYPKYQTYYECTGPNARSKLDRWIIYLADGYRNFKHFQQESEKKAAKQKMCTLLQKFHPHTTES